ncbi:hypothetical protein MHUMG1_01064 [Metarhizium humberi]|uniref:Uncharacterized protein n=1 Tax=Metarhizium humberi TaxID=2596975 RepID=A0A9P8MGP4_9HYPO|nr:hypothetical protein MHUMG1_01064 [Metarhizium humberi]
MPPCCEKLLLLFDELPEWAKDNEYIRSGWRPETNSYWECIKAWDTIHPQRILQHTPISLQPSEWWCWDRGSAYFLGILTVTADASRRAAGIRFRALHVESGKVWFTWIAVDLAARFLAAMLGLFVKSFQAPKVRPLRGLVFSVMASSAFYHLIIKIFQVGWSCADAEYSASLYALTSLIYLCPVTTYAVWLSMDGCSMNFAQAMHGSRKARRFSWVGNRSLGSSQHSHESPTKPASANIASILNTSVWATYTTETLVSRTSRAVNGEGLLLFAIADRATKRPQKPVLTKARAMALLKPLFEYR